MARGAFSVLFGILAFAWPGPTLLAVTLLWGAYVLADGLLAIATGLRQGRHHQPWMVPIVEGFLGIMIGLVTFAAPGLALYALSLLVGFWALLSGVLELLAAFRMGRADSPFQASVPARILLGLAGFLSIVLGGAIWSRPAIGALTLLSLVATYALLFGAVFIALGIRLRREQTKAALTADSGRQAA
jgi:uncharacterized membrane protein HdeD (DUF308 family)